MKKLFYSGLVILLLTSATAIGARPVKLPPPSTATSLSLPLVVWLSLLTTGVL